MLSRECARLFVACSPPEGIADGGEGWEVEWEEEEVQEMGFPGFERACRQLLPPEKQLHQEQLHAIFCAARAQSSLGNEEVVESEPSSQTELSGVLTFTDYMEAMRCVLALVGVTVAGGFEAGSATDMAAMRGQHFGASWGNGQGVLRDRGLAGTAEALKGIWVNTPRALTRNLQARQLVCGEETMQLREMLAAGDWRSAGCLLDRFRLAMAERHGHGSNAHAGAATQLVMFCVSAAARCRARGRSGGVWEGGADLEAALLRQAVVLTDPASGVPLWERERLRALAADLMARRLFRLRRHAAALQWAQAAIAAEPEPGALAVWTLHAGTVLAALGRRGAAIAAVRAALDLLGTCCAESAEARDSPAEVRDSARPGMNSSPAGADATQAGHCGGADWRIIGQSLENASAALRVGIDSEWASEVEAPALLNLAVLLRAEHRAGEAVQAVREAERVATSGAKGRGPARVGLEAPRGARALTSFDSHTARVGGGLDHRGTALRRDGAGQPPLNPKHGRSFAAGEALLGRIRRARAAIEAGLTRGLRDALEASAAIE